MTHMQAQVPILQQQPKVPFTAVLYTQQFAQATTSLGDMILSPVTSSATGPGLATIQVPVLPIAPLGLEELQVQL